MRVMMVLMRMIQMMQVIQSCHEKTSKTRLIVPRGIWYRRNSEEYFHDKD